MRKPFIAGNWKMNTTVTEAVSIVEEMKQDLDSLSTVDCVLCPPFISLHSLSELTKGTRIDIGAQNMYFKEKGAFTGEISPAMLKNLCKYVIIGHSERRQIFGETDEIVNLKVKAALSFGLLPILCIGETLSGNEKGDTNNILDRQIRSGLKDIPGNDDMVIAYEPIWAIGTGRAATGSQAGLTIAFIRSTLTSLWNRETAGSVRILYGGSVTAANISEFVGQPEIDGALVGGASLKPSEFVEIVRKGAEAKAKK